MTKALLFNIPAQGHVNPTLPLVAELLRRGEEIVYVNSEAFRTAIEAVGARFIAYPPHDVLEHMSAFASSGNIPQNALGLVRLSEELLPFANSLVEAQTPDYLIFDSLSSWAMVSARIYKLAAVALISTFAISRKTPLPVPPGAFVRILGGFARRYPASLQVGRRIRQKYGVEGVGLMQAVACTGDLNLVFTSRAMQPGADTFDMSFKFVGPLIGARPRQDGFPFELLRDDRPLIYISLGTINNQNLEFYMQCFAAFHDYPAQFVLSAGKETDLASLGEIPANFIVRNFVPQLEVLERASLFITHGGLNSVHEGLLNGVPLVLVPQQIEQAGVAGQVAAKGAGIALGMGSTFGQVSGAELRAAVERALGAENAKMRQNAKALGDSLREAGGAVRAVEEILTFAQARGSQKAKQE